VANALRISPTMNSARTACPSKVDNPPHIPYNLHMSKSIAIHAIITEPQLPCYGNRKATILRSGDGHTLECPCGSSVSFDASQAEADRIVIVFCGDTCRKDHIDDWLHIPVLSPSSTAKSETKSDKAKFCPECDGPSTRGKGWDHTSDCSLSSVNQAQARRDARPNCPECDGPPGQRRGWKHKDDCPKLQPKVVDRVVKPPCTECDGPARGKGYTHAEGCSLKPKPYVKTGRPKGRPAIKGRRRKMPAGI
jgi:hypothetical protein